ncbi:MAG: FAD-dependent oxidoreductase [Candidatus Hodarchaeales archaeon]
MPKVIVIGGNPAGLSAASAIRRMHPDWVIDVYEKDQYISYGSCGIPYYVAGEVKNLNKLITLTKDVLEKKRKIPIHLYHEITSVDFKAKLVHVNDKTHGERFTQDYDYLVIATGGKSKEPVGFEVDHPRVFKVHTLNDADRLKTFLMNNKVDSVVIMGGGYIGLEMIEAYLASNISSKNITIVGPRLVFRSESEEYIKKELESHGINIKKARVKKLDSISNSRMRVVLDSGEVLETDVVQLSIGVVPATDMFRDTELAMLPNGAIITDEFMRTNIPDVYAAGDCATSYHRILKKKVYIPLAPAANKQGRIAGSHIAGKKDLDPFAGVVGTSIFKVLDLYCARTGITIEEAESLGYQADSVKIESNEIAHYYPGANKMSVLLVFCTKTHRLLGAEITAPSPLGAKKIDVLATALLAEMKIDDIQKLDLAYAPPFSGVWDSILIAANVARKKCL